MSAPIPLAAPDGTVYAYACGRCHNTFATSTMRPRADVGALARQSMRFAARCCTCDCGAPADLTEWRRICAACAAREVEARRARAEARRADLAARGMQECPFCIAIDGLHFYSCNTCGGTGEVPL